MIRTSTFICLSDSNCYWIRFYHNGKLIRQSTKQSNYRTAVQMLQAIKTDLTRGTYSLDEPEVEPVPLFKDYAAYWLETYAKEHKRSWTRDVTSINHLNKVFGGMRLDDISREDVMRYRAARRQQTSRHNRKFRPASINRELACMRTIFNHAITERKVEYNPCAGRKVLLPENNKVDNTLSQTEQGRLFEACLEHCPRRIYWVMACGFGTGMRIGELLGLRWRNVDLENKTITVEAENAKNGKERTIDIGGGLASLLQEIRKVTKPRGPYVFGGRKPLKSIRNSFIKAKTAAGIDPKFRFHDIRHTVASRLITELNYDPVTVAEILGHSNPRMLWERYAHSRQEIKQRAIRELDESLLCMPSDTFTDTVAKIG